jgi:hypothetical protein
MRASIATVFVALVLGLTGAASSPSVGADPGASAGELTAAPFSAAGICTPAWGTVVIPICI